MRSGRAAGAASLALLAGGGAASAILAMARANGAAGLLPHDYLIIPDRSILYSSTSLERYGLWILPGRKVYTAVNFKNYFISHVAKNKIMTDGTSRGTVGHYFIFSHV